MKEYSDGPADGGVWAHDRDRDAHAALVNRLELIWTERDKAVREAIAEQFGHIGKRLSGVERFQWAMLGFGSAFMFLATAGVLTLLVRFVIGG